MISVIGKSRGVFVLLVSMLLLAVSGAGWAVDADTLLPTFDGAAIERPQPTQRVVMGELFARDG